jgi:plasmid stabilization system protein ParE
MLAYHPRAGHTRKDLTGKPLLFWPVGAYLIISQIKDSDIQILAGTHGARDIPSYLRRRN